jgi:hypothetical protein
MFTSSLYSSSVDDILDTEGDESEDELEDEVPWRSPSEKIAYVCILKSGFEPTTHLLMHPLFLVDINNQFISVILKLFCFTAQKEC